MYSNQQITNYQSWDNVGHYTHDDQAITRHVDLIEQVLDLAPLKECGLKVLIDVNHGTGAVADPILFDRLGIDVEYLYGTPDGKFSHTPELLAENLTRLCQQMKDGDYDIGFAQDLDADRLVIVDENGRFIGEIIRGV